MIKKWKKIKQLNEIANNWWTYVVESVELPNGKNGEYHFVHTNGSSMVIPVLDDDRLIMVKQYRYLADRESIEFPCGSVKNGSDYLATALAELAEEAGVTTEKLDFAAEFNPYNGVTDEMCKVFIARGLIEKIVPHDDTEEFERVILTKAEIDYKIQINEIWDGMTIAAWMLVRNKI